MGSMAQAANPLVFLKEAKTELSRVVWPTRAETIRLTAIVVGVSVGVGLFIGGLDILFVKLVELLLKR